MRVIADLHIHSRFSRATSEKMTITEIARFAKVKGLNIVGTGDFTHPRWLAELRQELAAVPERDLYKPANEPDSGVNFMVTGEVATIFSVGDDVKKIHHVILTPSFEIASQINDRLTRHGNLASDGRPILDMTASQLVEEVMQVSDRNMVIPAHAWTPWFSLFGAFSGFDRMEDCYQDTTKYIWALETGLSSDPPMNWRLSSLDRFALVSNSDSHSHWPWRLGREANVFELEKPTYDGIVESIRKKDSTRFKYTIETDPAYGKYHWTGHRNCKVSFSPQEALKFGNCCPVCRKSLTKGVEQRVEELADRPAGFRPENAIGYRRLLPLSEIITTVQGASYPSVQKVWEAYNALIAKFGNEYAVLLDAPMDEMGKIVDPKIAEAVVRVREGKVKVIPGYDGVYGRLVIFPDSVEAEVKPDREPVKQRSLADFV
jgi:uncharacterized protein (TIGR00375 family)